MLSGVFATTAKMELRNLIDQYCYDCSEGWFMVYAETRGKYEEFYQDLLSDATAKNIRNSFIIWRGNTIGFKDVTLNSFNACELQLEMLKDASYYKDKLTCYTCWKLTAEPVQMQC